MQWFVHCTAVSCLADFSKIQFLLGKVWYCSIGIRPKPLPDRQHWTCMIRWKTSPALTSSQLACSSIIWISLMPRYLLDMHQIPPLLLVHDPFDIKRVRGFFSLELCVKATPDLQELCAQLLWNKTLCCTQFDDAYSIMILISKAWHGCCSPLTSHKHHTVISL